MKTRHLFYLRALADLIDAGGSPDFHDVARHMGCSRKSVVPMMRRLRELGLVERASYCAPSHPTPGGWLALRDFSGTVAGYRRIRKTGPKPGSARRRKAAPAAPEPPAEAVATPVLRPGTLPRCGGWERRGPMRWRWVG